MAREEGGMHTRDLKPADIALLKDVAEQASEATVNRIFLSLGLDVSQPIKAQQDFAFLRRIASGAADEEERADREWVRRSRRRSESISTKIINTSVGLLVVGAMNAFWAGMTWFMTHK
jgi:hypothetical protein